MKYNSIWNDTKNCIKYPMLEEDKEVDVLIIGGGITGVSTLYNLRDTNLNVMLVEQNKIGFSTTGNSTGKLTFLQNDLLNKIREKYNDNVASLYLKSQINTIENIINTIKTEKIDCDLEQVDSYMYTEKSSEIDEIKSLESFLLDNGIEVYHDDIDIVEGKYTVNVKNTYIFNPIKFVYGLLKNNEFPVYENTSIKNIELCDNEYICNTDSNKIKTKYVIIASHYPYFIFPYMFPFKVSLEKSYLSASKCDVNPFSLISYSNPFISIRTYKEYLIYLSNSHSINADVCDKDNYNELLKKIDDLNLKADYLWSNIDIITSDGLPIVGKIKDNMFIATGYNTWGLTNGYLASCILKDLILCKDNDYLELFDPCRHNLISAGDMLKSVDGFIKGMLNGTDYTCPHLGCKLIYNEVDNTFDCPCHGSRFNKNGKCISGPANEDIEINT